MGLAKHQSAGFKAHRASCFFLKFKYDAKISSKANGKFKKGVIFATYSSLIGESQATGKYNTRMSQLLHWCSAEFDGVVSFRRTIDLIISVCAVFLKKEGLKVKY